MSKRATAKPRGSAKTIEAAVEPIERLELLISAAQQNFRDREIEPRAAQHVAVALDMMEAEAIALRRILYGEELSA